MLITGAGGGLGRLLAIRMTRLGAKTILWDISKDGERETKILSIKSFPHRENILPGLKETSNILQAMGGEYKEQIVDISKKEEVYKAAEHIRQTMGDVSGIQNFSFPTKCQHLVTFFDHEIFLENTQLCKLLCKVPISCQVSQSVSRPPWRLIIVIEG